MSLDAVPDGVPSSDLELLKARYKLDNQSVEAVQLILKQVPLGDLASVFTEDFFVRQLIPLITDGDPSIKLRALELMHKWLSTKAKKAKGKRINIGN